MKNKGTIKAVAILVILAIGGTGNGCQIRPTTGSVRQTTERKQ